MMTLSAFHWNICGSALPHQRSVAANGSESTHRIPKRASRFRDPMPLAPPALTAPKFSDGHSDQTPDNNTRHCNFISLSMAARPSATGDAHRLYPVTDRAAARSGQHRGQDPRAVAPLDGRAKCLNRCR
jgi:hypothetical protein